jgi:hypothetical protein
MCTAKFATPKVDVRFGTLMSILATAWTKIKSDNAAENAKAILQYMDLKNASPNTITYNAIFNAIAVGNQVDKDLKAEDIVKMMKQQHEELGQDCVPDVYSYQSLIHGKFSHDE